MKIQEKIEHYLNEAKKPTIYFHTNSYERAHGKKPSGRGGWAFDIEEPELVKLLAKHKDISGTHGEAVFVKGSMTLVDAKKVIKKAIIDVWPSDAKVSYVDVEVAS